MTKTKILDFQIEGKEAHIAIEHDGIEWDGYLVKTGEEHDE